MNLHWRGFARQGRSTESHNRRVMCCFGPQASACGSVRGGLDGHRPEIVQLREIWAADLRFGAATAIAAGDPSLTRKGGAHYWLPFLLAAQCRTTVAACWIRSRMCPTLAGEARIACGACDSPPIS
jgi:hypothetical protein